MQPLIAVPTITLLLYRAWSRQSLTPFGLVVAGLTATAHAVHPWGVFLALLGVFFLGATTATKAKHEVKARLTLSASGSSGGEGPRTHIQVLANSGVASVLILLHARQLWLRESLGEATSCYSWRGDLLVIGIIANYAAVAADTFSSELGILSPSRPRLITSLNLRKVPPGTNGGVTSFGLLAGLMGSSTIAATALLLLPLCGNTADVPLAGWGPRERLGLWLAITLCGGLGSLVDSFLGGWLQASVVDVRTGKVVEGEGGRKVLVRDLGPWSLQFTKPEESGAPVDPTSAQTSALKKADNEARSRATGSKDSLSTEKPHPHSRPASRKVESGLDLLDNNAVNLLMAAIMSIGGMVVASWVWNIPLSSIVS